MSQQVSLWKHLDCKFYIVKEMNEVGSYGEWEWNRDTYYYFTNIYNDIKDFATMYFQDRELSVYFIEHDGRIFLPAADVELDYLPMITETELVLALCCGLLYEVTGKYKAGFLNLISTEPDYNTEKPYWLLKLIELGKANIDNWL